MNHDGDNGDPALHQKGHIFGTAVEVLALEQDVWYSATLLHLSQPGWVVVQLAGTTKEVPMSQVRLLPEATEAFLPKLNDLVEVQMPATSTKPPCMLAGAVRMARGAYFLVSLLGRGRHDDILVKAEQLREPGQTTLLSTCLVQEEVFELPPGFIEPVNGEDPLTSDFKEWLLHFQQQSSMLSLELRFTTFGAELKVAGARSKMSLAGKMLHSIHMRTWGEIAKRRSQLKEMESRRSLLESLSREEGHCAEFTVEVDIMRLILGRCGGKRLQELQDSLGVSIEVRYDSRQKHHSVRILGEPEAVQAARRQLQFVKKLHSFPKEHLGYILGKQLGNIQMIAEKVGLLNVRFDSNSEALEMMGLQDQVESAEMLIQAHMDYREVYEEMEQEHGALTQSFQALDDEYRMRKGKGKGNVTRQYRARTPPPTAKMFAMGRLRKPAQRDEDCDWRGSKNRVNSSPASRPPGESRVRAKGGSKNGKNGKHVHVERMGAMQTEEWKDGNDIGTKVEKPEEEDDELLPHGRETEPHTDTPELDEDSDSDDAVPSFLFDSSP